MNDNNQFNREPMSNNNQFNNQINNQPINNNQFNNQQVPFNTNQEQSNPTDNMDYSFVEPKKKSKAWIVILLIVILLLGGCAYYYFILTSPKAIFSKIINNDNLKLTENSVENKAAKTNINFKLNTKDELYKDTTDLLKNINLEFSYDINNEEELIYNLKATYKNKSILDAKAISKKDITYLSLKDVYDKVLSITTKEENTDEISTEVYKEIYISITNALIESLKDATYEKTITKYNSKYVTKATLKIDDKLVKNICDKLLKDDKFITNISNITKISSEEVTDEINEIMSYTNDINANINLYLSLLSTEVLSVEIGNQFNNITIDLDNNQYKYKIISESDEVLSGYIETKETNKVKTCTLGIYEPTTQVNITATISIEPISKLETFDITGSKDIDSLTEEESNKILEGVYKQEGINLLIEDLGLNEETEV